MKEAKRAIEEMDGQEFMEQRLRVDWAFLKGVPFVNYDYGAAQYSPLIDSNLLSPMLASHLSLLLHNPLQPPGNRISWNHDF